jgi:peptide/nickel transport system ATP-binding protein
VALLEVSGLTVTFATRAGPARAVDGLGFHVEPGETIGIVGESGCGKSMTALAIMGLIPPSGKIAGGSICLSGEELVGASPERLREIRGNEISMIFQEPRTALNPVFTIGEQIAETLRRHQGLDRGEARAQAIEALRRVGIAQAELRIDDYPHRLSGGMLQRVMIAMALACKPKILIADEPTTALDVTVQAQILDLLRELTRSTGTAIILITHNMGVIAEMADSVIVMYAGRAVEHGSVQDVLLAPRHPYTQGLLACLPPGVMSHAPPTQLSEIPGRVPLSGEIVTGCAFAPRCTVAMDHCRQEAPPDFAISPGHGSACFLAAAGAP